MVHPIASRAPLCPEWGVAATEGTIRQQKTGRTPAIETGGVATDSDDESDRRSPGAGARPMNG
jgi:hypothetical protein